MTDFQIWTRGYGFRLVVVMCFGIIALRLWFLQINQGELYSEKADQNRFRLASVEAPRGVIYDRDGGLVVRNRASYNVAVIPSLLPDDATQEARITARLSELLNLPVTTQIDPRAGYNDGHFHAIMHHQYNRQLVQQIINPRSRRYINAPQGIRDAINQGYNLAPFRPVVVAKDVDPLIVAKIEEERLDLPGVVIQANPIRDYIYKDLLAPILGYTGPIPAEQFTEYKNQGYELTDKIGLAGLEYVYEELLRGSKGVENIEIDASGQKVRTLNEVEKAIPGYNLRLTLDMGLQKVTAEALQEMMEQQESNQGAAIAMNPNTGEILAMVSLPSYDNNIFSRGITARELSLLSENPWTPLINHAVSGFYPPGSTFKIVTAAGALQERTVEADTIFYDEGTLYLPNQFFPDNRRLDQPFFCWLRSGHAEVNARLALAYSCNVYFYQIGGGYFPTEYEGLGIERLGQYARLFGYGAESGIDLPAEGAGLVPDARWKRLNHAERWLTGDTYNMSVGQGFMLATPLQVVNSYAAIANGGTLYRPFVVKAVSDEKGQVIRETQPEVLHTLNLDSEVMGVVQDGLRMVVSEEAGTARKNFDVPGLIASGKTGTAEYCDEYPQCIDRSGRVKTKHAWFASYAPSYAPEIVTVVFVYGGDEGSVASIPVTNKMLRYYFKIGQDLIQDEATEEEPEASDTEPITPTFTAELLGADQFVDTTGRPLETASIAGFVLDETRQGVAGIPIELIANGQVMVQLVSGETGQFDYNLLDPNLATRWQIRLGGYPTQSPLDLEISKGLRYLLEFQRIEPKPIPEN